MNKTGALVIAGFVFTCFQAHANGKVVSVLPEPVGDVYVLGSSTSEANATADGAVNYDYINWSALNVPAGSTVRLNGAIVLDAMPDNLTYDWSACTRLALVGADLRAALDRLAPEDRELLLLRCVNEVPWDTLSALYGVSRFALSRRCKALLTKLKRELEG